MNHFEYRNNEMYCEDVPVRAIADEVGTPLYLYSHATLERHFRAFDGAFGDVSRIVCFSAKANSNLAVLRLLRNLGSGLDIVSGGELYRGLKAGFAPNRVVYSGVGKRIDEIDYALGSGILLFNVESTAELKVIDERARVLKTRAPVAIRVNPDVDAKTHPYISTGLKESKFGMDTESALEGYKAANRLENVDIIGIDCHIGSQITDATPFRDALGSIMALRDELEKMGIGIAYLDVGGGLGITYDDESPPDPGEYARAIIDSMGDRPMTLILEPGRVIVGNAGILVSKVLYRKTDTSRSFVIVDAAMNDLIRPALYDAFHAIRPVIMSARESVTVDVVGPVCESGDFLATDRHMPEVREGDLVCVMSAGAYGFVMSSNYCSRPRVAEVMVKGDAFHVVKARQTYEDLVEGEQVPEFLV